MSEHSLGDQLVISARGLRKSFGGVVALDGIDLEVGSGRIVALIGPNGAGKTTALNAILGLSSYDGELEVLGLDPWNERNALMRDVCFMADIAVLPRWMKVAQLLEYVAAVHPRFSRERATDFLSRTTIKQASKVRDLSKGMVTQLHLAIVMAIDARLLVLDEPTLGLDLIFRKRFFDTLLEDYYDRQRTIVLATHNVDEIEHVVSDVIFMDRGRIVLNATRDELDTRFTEVKVHPDRVKEARTLGPVSERTALGQSILLFDGLERARLAALGDVRTPSIGELFVAHVGQSTSWEARAE